MEQFQLDAVPETMLCTLYSRASASRRCSSLFRDPGAERIYRAIDYPFARHFGPPDVAYATRARAFDKALKDWLVLHPKGMVIELGCGLETQCQRVDNGQMHWLAVDVPQAMTLRERFIKPTERLRHWHGDAFDLTWMGATLGDETVFVSAQGLLMYFKPSKVCQLLKAIAERFPSATIVFDVVPSWLIPLTQSRAGYWRTPCYRMPAMHWGVSGQQIESVMHDWLGPVVNVNWQPYQFYWPLPQWYCRALKLWPLMPAILPGIVQLQLAPSKTPEAGTGPEPTA